MTQASTSEMGATSSCPEPGRAHSPASASVSGLCSTRRRFVLVLVFALAPCLGEKLCSAALGFQPGLVSLGEVWWGGDLCLTGSAVRLGPQCRL